MPLNMTLPPELQYLEDLTAPKKKGPIIDLFGAQQTTPDVANPQTELVSPIPTRPVIQPKPNQSIGMGIKIPMLSNSQEAKELTGLRKDYLGSSDELIADQQRGVSDLEGELAKLKATPKKEDLSWLMAISDSLGDTNMLKNYKAPETEEQRQEKFLKLQDMIQKERQGIAKSKLDQLGDLMKWKAQDQNGSLALRIAELQARQGMRSDTLTEKRTNRLQDAINNDVFAEKNPEKSFSAITGNFRTMTDNFASGNRLGFVTGLGTYMRQAMNEKGALSNEDRAIANPASVDKMIADVSAFVTSNPNSEIPPNLYKPFLDVAVRSQKRLSDQYANKLKNYENQYSRKPGYEYLMNAGEFGRESFDDAKRQIEEFRNYQIPGYKQMPGKQPINLGAQPTQPKGRSVKDIDAEIEALKKQLGQ